MNTPEGRRKAAETNRKKDPDYYKKIGAKGGQNSSHRPMKDPKFASKAVKKRWEYEQSRKINEQIERELQDGSKTDV